MIIMITGDIDGLPGLYVMIISLCGTIRDHQDNFEIIIIMTIDHLYQGDHNKHLSAVRPHPALGANARSRDAKTMTGAQRVGTVS